MAMKALAVALIVAGGLASGGAGAQGREETMVAPHFVVLAHGSGSLALRAAEIATVWYLPAAAEKSSQIRITSLALTEPKTLTGSDADALWERFHSGPLAAEFVFASHMQGLLAIPRDQIRTAFYSEQGGAPQLRLVYDGDPSGKTVTGEEASRLWATLTK